MRDLTFNLTGTNLRDTLRLLLDSGLFEKVRPSSLKIDSAEQPVKDNWLAVQIGRAKHRVIINWDERYAQEMRFYPGDPDRIWVSLGKELTEQTLLSCLETLPFAHASFDTLHPQWCDLEPDYVAPSFSNGHYPHGWACAIKGQEGHAQLVSRRWLAYGPWETIEAGNDLTFIRFHCATADAATALAQAKPGHAYMGISDEGGFMQDDYIFDYPIRGTYEPDKKTLKVIVHGADLTPRQLLDYSAARRLQVLGEEQPLEQIRFIFMEKSQAEKYVATLWLRNMECYAIDGGREVRLDAAFTPPPRRAPW